MQYKNLVNNKLFIQALLLFSNLSSGFSLKFDKHFALSQKGNCQTSIEELPIIQEGGKVCCKTITTLILPIGKYFIRVSGPSRIIWSGVKKVVRGTMIESGDIKDPIACRTKVCK